MQLILIGAGYSGEHIAREARTHDAVERVVATRRAWPDDARSQTSADGCERITFAGETIGKGHPLDEALETATHLVSSVPPARGERLVDAALDALRPRLEAGRHSLRWLGYLSTIGVYGDHAGDWVDETTPPDSRQARSRRRVEAEDAWRALAARLDVPATIFRLAGIYGPGRNAIRDAEQGQARIIDKPGQVFNRIHVDDIAGLVGVAMGQAFDGTLNVVDDRPAPNGDVVRFAHRLVDRVPPEPIPFDDAELSPMARSFYAETKRVSNRRSRERLGYDYRWPDYESGLTGLWRQDRWREPCTRPR